jgi:DNA replication protein DnaC
MLREVTGQLTALKLGHMARGLERWLENPANAERSPLECVAAMVATHQQMKSTVRVEDFLSASGLPPHLTLAAFDLQRIRGLSRLRFATLRTLAWLEMGHNLIVTGGPSTGKRHLAAGLAVEAVRRGWSARHVQVADLLHQRDLALHRGNPDQLFTRMIRPALLVLDGFADMPTLATETAWLRRIVVRRATLKRPIIVTSRHAPKGWGQYLEGLSVADAVIGELKRGAEAIRLQRRSTAI